jgi:DNA-binding response OmpR family regulator
MALSRNLMLADNDRDFLRSRAEVLELRGFRVYKADSVTEAKHCFRNHHIDLAIIDQRLTDNDNELDTSGIDLAKDSEFAAIPKLILTAYPDVDSVKAAMQFQPKLGQPAAINYVKKEDDDPEALLKAIHDAFAHHIKTNFVIDIVWGSYPPAALLANIDPSCPPNEFISKSEELDNLFRRLFYTSDKLIIDKLIWKHDHRIAISVSSYRNDQRDQYLVVCGPHSVMFTEQRCFEEYSPTSAWENMTNLLQSESSLHFRAILYSLAGADLDKVSSLLQRLDADTPQTLRPAFDRLFRHTLATWRGLGPQLAPQQTLDEWYRDYFDFNDLSFVDVRNKIEKLTHWMVAEGVLHDHAQQTVEFDLHAIKYVNPIEILGQAFEVGRPLTLVRSPGNLRGTTILMNAQNHIWLTDFIGSGVVPNLWNFIALEAAIVLDNADFHDLHVPFAIEHELQEGDFYQLDVHAAGVRGRKILTLVQTIRTLSRELANVDQSSYVLGLMFQAMKRVCDFEPTSDHRSFDRIRAFHSLLMAGRLLAWIQSRQPNSLDIEAQSGLVIDMSNHEVSVNGRKKPVTGQGLTILKYLYQRSGNLCTREELFKHVWSMQYNVSEASHVNRLTKAIDRLRDHIEPDPANPCYLHNQMGKGYILTTTPSPSVHVGH